MSDRNWWYDTAEFTEDGVAVSGGAEFTWENTTNSAYTISYRLEFHDVGGNPLAEYIPANASLSLGMGERRTLTVPFTSNFTSIAAANDVVQLSVFALFSAVETAEPEQLGIRAVFASSGDGEVGEIRSGNRVEINIYMDNLPASVTGITYQLHVPNTLFELGVDEQWPGVPSKAGIEIWNDGESISPERYLSGIALARQVPPTRHFTATSGAFYGAGAREAIMGNPIKVFLRGAGGLAADVSTEIILKNVKLYQGGSLPEIVVPADDILLINPPHLHPSPELTLSTQALEFGSMFVGDSPAKQFTVSNTGSGALSISAIEANISGISVTPLEFSLAPNESIEVNVVFTPGLEGVFQGQLSITSNDPATANTVLLTGQAYTHSTPRFSLDVTDRGVSQGREWVEVAIRGANLSEFRQLELRVKQTPGSVFNLRDTEFQEPVGSISLGVELFDASTVSFSAVWLGSTMQGEHDLGTLVFWSDERLMFNATIEMVYASIGPSSILRQTFDYSGDITTTVEPDIVLVPGPITMDFDPEDGDQGSHRITSIETNDLVSVQLNIAEVDPIKGWSANFLYDPAVVEYISGSFLPGPYLTGLVPLVAERVGRVDLGGVVFGDAVARGSAGTLGSLQFRILPGYADSTAIEISQVNLQVVGEGERILNVSAIATISSERSKLLGDFNGDGEVNFSDFFVFADGFGGTRSDLDLTGDGEVNFSDFFVFADVFGTGERAKLLILAQEYIGLPMLDVSVLAYPNPFNASTVISLANGTAMRRVTVFNQLGQVVKNIEVGLGDVGGRKSVSWNGTNEVGRQVGTGLYIVRVDDGMRDYIGKLTLIR